MCTNMIKLWIIVLILAAETSIAWPFGDEEERINRLSIRITEAVDKLKSADDEMWKNFLRINELMKRDIDALAYKMNEVITEVNQLKVRVARYL